MSQQITLLEQPEQEPPAEQRFRRGTQFERKLFKAIKDLGFAIAMNGTEHTHPDFADRLRQSNDQTSLAIRFQPDAVASIGKIPRSFFIEAKAAHTVERQAWEQYWKLQEMGNILVIVFEDFGWAWNFLEHIRLHLGEETVSPFPPEMRFPVIDHWICPRAGQRWGEIRRNVPRASGTDYREVDGSALIPWSEFKPNIIQRLQQAVD